MRRLAVILALGATLAVANPEYKHGVSFFGEFKYPPGFEHFDYVNPDAPKGGTLVLSTNINWNSFTPYLDRGIETPGVSVISHPILYNGLFAMAPDELGTFYADLAEAVMVADDFTRVRVRMRPEARWHDGEPVTARDVAFTFDYICNDSSPNIRSAFAMVASTEIHNDLELTFHLRNTTGLNANAVISLGKLAILPEHYWRERDITRTTLTPPLGSGPYRVAAAEQGRYLLFERVPDFWGRDLGVHRGRHNFDYIRYDFYRDATITREALRKGLVDFRQETDPRHWHDGYNIPARDKGWIVMRRHKFGTYVGLRGLAINARRPNLQDVRVREALTLAFDYDWYERNITRGYYSRPRSYFSHTSFAAVGLPDAAERALLAPFRDRLPKRLFTHPFELPRAEGVGRNRAALLRARELLRESGWTVRDGVLTNDAGEPFSLSFIVRNANELRSITQFVDQLKRLGFKPRVRMVETSQYIRLMEDFDFDISEHGYWTAQPAGVEVVSYWHSSNALLPHVRNRSGIQNEAVDEMLMRVLNARSRAELTAAQRALDRVLLWNFYMIPLVAAEGPRVVYWDKFGRPPNDSEYRTNFPDAWWYDETKAARIGVAN